MPATTEQPQWQPPSPQQQKWTPAPPNPAEKAARHALGWSLAGFFTCCFPLSIIGLVLGFRSRSLAAKQNILAPLAGTIALALSSLVLAGVLIFGVWFTIDSMALSERVAELTAKVSSSDSSALLSQQTACDLAELRIRTDGWKEDSAIIIDGFECPGQVTQKESEAELPDFSFNASGSTRVTVTVCYKRGARWTVKAFRETGGCLDQPIAEPPQPE